MLSLIVCSAAARKNTVLAARPEGRVNREGAAHMLRLIRVRDELTLRQSVCDVANSAITSEIAALAWVSYRSEGHRRIGYLRESKPFRTAPC